MTRNVSGRTLSDRLMTSDKYDFAINRWIAILPIFAAYYNSGMVERWRPEMVVDLAHGRSRANSTNQRCGVGRAGRPVRVQNFHALFTIWFRDRPEAGGTHAAL